MEGRKESAEQAIFPARGYIRGCMSTEAHNIFSFQDANMARKKETFFLDNGCKEKKQKWNEQEISARKILRRPFFYCRSSLTGSSN